MRRTSLLLLALGLVSTGCTGSSGGDSGSGGGPTPPNTGGNPTESLENIDTDADGDGDDIVDLPASVDPFIGDLFARYTAVWSPNGGRIHLLAEAGVPDSKLRRARAILDLHLVNVAGTSQGANKADVANAMAAAGATLAIFQNASTADPNQADVSLFIDEMGERVLPLLADRCIVEGSPEYVAALPAEDNTFGVTAALVYRTGLVNARPSYAAELESLAQAAIASGSFVAPANAPADEIDDAFVVLTVDCHSGVWGHDPRGDGRSGSEFEYAFASRPAMAAGDPATLAWIEAFFAPTHEFHAIVDPNFSGTFDGLLRGSTPYSNRSQYLRCVSLSGTNNAELFGAPISALLVGNSGNNNIKGRAGDDDIVGGDGFDTAVFSGPMANYTITFQGNQVIVEDIHGGHDGYDVLEEMERLQFTDQGINL